jgi:hypothetical protein
MRLNQSAAYTSDGPCEARPDGKLDVALRRLDDENDRLARVLGKIETVADRVLGSAPIGPSTGKPEPVAVPNGTLDRLHDAITRTSQLAGYLNNHADRLSEIG